MEKQKCSRISFPEIWVSRRRKGTFRRNEQMFEKCLLKTQVHHLKASPWNPLLVNGDKFNTFLRNSLIPGQKEKIQTNSVKYWKNTWEKEFLSGMINKLKEEEKPNVVLEIQASSS